MRTITPEEKDPLLLELLSNGRGSLDYAKNLIAEDAGHPDPEWSFVAGGSRMAMVGARCFGFGG